MAQTVEYQLPENLTVAHIHPVHEQFELLVDEKTNDHIVLLADSVIRADTAGIQLLYALVVAAKERQITLTWHNPSESLRAAALTLGMVNHLGIH